jgi:iron complex outermembrane receptor protein
MCKLLKVVLVLFASIVSVQAQRGACEWQISGHVLDEHEGERLPFATIAIKEDATKGTTTDEKGNFSITQLCAGKYTLVASHIGCEPIEQVIELTGDTVISFQLEHHAELLEMVNVRSKRLRSKSTAAESTLEGIELDRLRGKTLGESLASFSGVNSISTGANISKPVIHGLHSSRVQVMNQGVQQEGQEWGIEHAPEIDPFAATEIRVIKGVGAVEYGIGALGGVVLLESKPLEKEVNNLGELNIIGMSNGRQLIGSAKFASRFTRFFTASLQTSFKKSGDLNAPDYQLTNTAAEEFNFSSSLFYQKDDYLSEIYWSRFDTEIGILRSAHIGNLTDLEIALNSDEPFFVEDFSYDILNPKQAVTHNLWKFRNEWKTDMGTWKTLYSFQLNERKEFDIRRGDRDDRPAVDLNLQAHRGQVSWNHQPLWDQWVGKIGIDTYFKRNRNIPGTGTSPLIPWYNSVGTSIFLIERWLMNDFQFEVGGRYDFQYMQVKTFDSQSNLEVLDYNFNGLTAAIGGVYRPSEHWSVTSNLGYAFRPPNISELFSEGLHHSAGAIEEGNRNLNPEKGIKWITAFTYEQEQFFNIELDAYVHYIQDYIYLRPQAEPRLTIRGAFPVFSYTQTDARLYGFDFTGNVQLVEYLNLKLKSSIIRARDLTEEQPLFLMPADRFQVDAFYSLSGNRRLKDIRFGIGYQYVARQTRVQEGIDYAPPPDAYGLFRSEVSANLLIGDNTLSVSLSANNLLNQSYRDYLNRLRYFADDVGRNIELRIKYQFIN